MKLVLIGEMITLKLDIQLDLKHFSMNQCEIQAQKVAESLGFITSYIELDGESE